MPFPFIKSLTFSKTGWWNMMNLTTCAVWWNMMQNLTQNLNWNIAISLDTYCLMWFFFFFWTKLLAGAKCSKMMWYCRRMAQLHINLFPIRTWEHFWCLEGSEISSNVTSLLANSRYLLTKNLFFFPKELKCRWKQETMQMLEV